MAIKAQVSFYLGFLAVAEAIMLAYWIQTDDAKFSIAGCGRLLIGSVGLALALTLVLNIVLGVGETIIARRLFQGHQLSQKRLFLAGTVAALCSVSLTFFGSKVVDFFLQDADQLATQILVWLATVMMLSIAGGVLTANWMLGRK